MNLKTAIRARYLYFLKRYFNPFTRRLAYSRFGPFAIVRHVGRRSGKPYETPIIVQRAADGFVFELTYGADVDWYKNVQAAGRFTLHWHGKDYPIERIEPLDAAVGRSAFPMPQRLILRILGMKHFLKMVTRQ